MGPTANGQKWDQETMEKNPRNHGVFPLDLLFLGNLDWDPVDPVDDKIYHTKLFF